MALRSSTLLEETAHALGAQPAHTRSTLALALSRSVGEVDADAEPLVRRGEHWELHLRRWLPGELTSFQAYGETAHAWRVLRGAAREIVLGRRDRIWARGSVVEGEDLHQLGNAGPEPLVTLHAFSPRPTLPTETKGTEVVIVGGGFSGVAVAIHLLARADRALRITLLERGPWLGRGIAYGVDHEVFRLNVPASRMSLDPTAPLDFVTWAHAESQPHAFLSRALYGKYVTERLRRAVCGSQGRLRVVRADALRVEPDAVVLAGGGSIRAHAVVLATGLAPRLSRSMLPAHPRIVDAWDEQSLLSLPASGELLILGAGLTALDVVALLETRGFDGRITIVSRRGLLPRAHLRQPAKAADLSESLANVPTSLRGLLAWGRRAVKDTTTHGEPWQSAIDAMRPHVGRFWRVMTPKDRSRFVRSVRAYWDVLRHRAPPEALARVQALRDAGRLDLVAGELVSCEPRGDALHGALRREGRLQPMRWDAIVRCIGPALELSESDAPIVRHLVASGRAIPDGAGLGIATDEDGRVVGATSPTQDVFAIGALRRASAWETTSVPEIAAHALRIATVLRP
jgi:uncharacterized NAD(P)/FAD-binding protein YdhS